MILIWGAVVSACLPSLADQPPWGPSQEALARNLILANKCGACHTLLDGDLQLRGSLGPDLTRQGQRGRSRQWLRRQLLDPRSIPDEEVVAGYEGKQKYMPPVRSLSQQELEILITYLQRLQ